MIDLPQELKTALNNQPIFSIVEYLQERAQQQVGISVSQMPAPNQDTCDCGEECAMAEQPYTLANKPIYMVVPSGAEFDTLEEAKEHIQELLDEDLLDDCSCVVKTTLENTWEVTQKAELVPSLSQMEN